MAFGTLVQKAITWGSDKVGKNSTTDGAIRKNEWSIAQIYSAVATTISASAPSDDKLVTEQGIAETTIRGDGTAGRALVSFSCTFSGSGGTSASMTTQRIWNANGGFIDVTGDSCNLNATSTGGNWSLNATGDTATLIAEAKCLSAGKDFLSVISAVVVDQNTTAPLYCYARASGGNLLISFTDASSDVVDMSIASRFLFLMITVVTG